MSTDAIIRAVSSVRFNFVDESELQRGIEVVLSQNNIPFRREVRLSREDRLDFLCEGTAIEAKTKGSLSPLLRQLSRYAHQDAVKEILVLTTKTSHRAIPETLHGKPVRVVLLNGGAF